MRIKVKETHMERVLIAALCVLIIGLRVLHISELRGPVIFDDEMGYWSHAANLSGFDWKNTTSLWYSYGYSLILIPLFSITHDMSILYKIAVGMNALLGVGNFILGYLLLVKLNIKCSNMVKIIFSFIAACYSAYLFQSTIAWSESLLYFWFTLLLYVALYFFEKPTYVNSILVSFCIVFLYVIHNRAIVISIAFVIAIAYMCWKRKIHWKYLCAVAATAFIGFFLDRCMRDYVSLLMWGYKDAYVGNDMSSNLGKLTDVIFTMEGISKLLLSFAGKIWYVFTATLSLAYFGVVYIVKEMIRLWKDNNNKIIFYIFLLFSFLGVVAVSTIAMIPHDITERTRLDVVFYGRYSDMICGMLIIFGLLEIRKLQYRNLNHLKEVLLGMIVYLSCTIPVFAYVALVSESYSNIVCVPGVYLFKDIYFEGCFAVVFAILLGIFIYIAVVKKVQLKKVSIALLTVVLLALFFIDYGHVYKAVNFKSAHKRLFGVCDVIADNPTYDLFYMGGNYTERQVIRTRAIENTMYFEAPAEEADDYFYIADWKMVMKDTLEYQDYYFVMAFEPDAFLVKGQNISKELEEQGYELYRVGDIRPIDISDIQEMEVAGGKDYATLGDSALVLDIKFTLPEKIIFTNEERYRLFYHIYDDEGNIVVKDGMRTDFEQIVNQETVQMIINVGQITQPGKYVLEIDMVKEGDSWLSSKGLKTTKYEITILE